MSKTGIRLPFNFFVCFWLHRVFVALLKPSLIAASPSWLRLLFLWSSGCRRVGSGSCCAWTQRLWPTGSVAPQHANLPRPGIGPMSPAPPGKSCPSVLNNFGLPKARWCYWKRTCPPAQRRHKRQGSIPGWGSFPGERARQPTLVFLPGQCHGQRSPGGRRPQDCTQSDVTEATSHSCMHTS